MSHSVIPCYKTGDDGEPFLAGYWAGSDDTPTEKFKPEWKGLMKFTKYIRGTMQEKRVERARLRAARRELSRLKRLSKQLDKNL